METVKNDSGAILVRRIPGDGHCLFAALVNQFYGFPLESTEHSQAVRQLRSDVADYLREDLERFTPGIIYAIQEESRKDIVVHEGLIREFLEKLEKGNMWGGEETIVAVSELWRCKIEVYEEEGPVSSYNDSGVAHKLLRIAFRKNLGSRSSRNHYDSVVQKFAMNRYVYAEGTDSQGQEPSSEGTEERLQPAVSQIGSWQQRARQGESQISAHSLPVEQPVGEKDRAEKIKFASWNVRGCSDAEKREALRGSLRQRNSC